MEYGLWTMEYSLWIMGDVVGSSGSIVVVIYLRRRQDMRERTAGAKGLYIWPDPCFKKCELE